MAPLSLPARSAHLRFGRKTIPRRRRGERWVIEWISAGGGGAQPRDPLSSSTLGASGGTLGTVVPR